MLSINEPMRARERNSGRLRWFSLLAAVFALFTFGPGEALGGASGPNYSPSQVSSQFTIADFDGDRQPDVATVQVGASTPMRTHYWIAFQLSNGLRSTLGITAPTGGLNIVSRDVNGDAFPDVVITTAWTNRPVAILLNDGLGNFSQFDPQAFPAAFSNPAVFLTSDSREIRDAFAGLSSRYSSGECDEPVRILSCRNASGGLPHEPWQDSQHFPIARSRGRAPPSFRLLS